MDLRIIITAKPSAPPLPAAARSSEAIGGITVTLNAEKAGVEIRFPLKPPVALLGTLKAHGWRWSRFSSCWYQRNTTAAREFAAGIASSGS